ncbi:long-chain-fatty-acid--CoA ligase 1-like [Orbicella faveolata]|uniref:long-chain-fatty-acid--CoA ligase 1-like n=1 Tax=Orbicella faveolata TaxID=48498 RepID=UPI0009E58814|nr:long-chain-fatty-acid--CoA ligase 1-like [Orbicella faveolata]
MSNEWFDALSEASSGTLAIFTAVSGFIVLLLVRLWRNSRFAMDPPPEMQSVEIEGTDGARRTTLTTEIVTRQYPDVGTVYESFLLGVKISGDGPCLGTWDPDIKKYTWLTYNQVSGTYTASCVAGVKISGDGPCLGTWDPDIKKYTWLTYNQVHERATYVGAGLVAIGCEPSQKTFIGIYGPNRVEWTLTDLGCQMFSMISVPVYDAHGTEECIYIINHAKPEDILTVCYTSGTTGPPKGAILTHANLVADISAYRVHMRQTGFELTPEDVHLSFLPLAHMYERINHLNLLLSGARIGYYSGDIKRLLEDCKELKPTIFSAVPRLLNRIYDKVMSGVSKSKLKRWIFQMALRSKESDLKRRIISKNTIWDYLVLRKVQNLLGGRVRYMPCGSAPLSAKVTSFIRCVMGCYLTEGYGQTECAAAATFQLYNDLTTAGHVGPPVPSNIIKLVDVEEKAYFAKNGQGEICLKGPSVFKGYLHDPEKTAETIDEDGWLHTGDVGEWLPNGTLKIIDRKKNIFKLSQGEFIAPEKIQNVYLRSPFIAQVFVYGNSYKSFLVAIAVPDAEVLQTWAKSNGLEGDIKQLCQDEIVHKVIFQDMLAKGNEGGLNSLEQVSPRALIRGFTVYIGLSCLFAFLFSLKIVIDIKVNHSVISQGEFIAPEKIQNVYLRSPFIAQVFVYGNSYKSFLVAIAVPDAEVLQTWAKSNGLEGDIKQLCQDEIVHKVIFQDMLAKGNEGGLNSLEQVKKIYLHPDIFSIENGLLTPTFKAKRPEILRTFKEEIERLYEEVEMELTEKTKQG